MEIVLLLLFSVCGCCWFGGRSVCRVNGALLLSSVTLQLHSTGEGGGVQSRLQ